MSDLRSALNEDANEFPFTGGNRAADSPKAFAALREVLKVALNDYVTEAMNDGDEQRRTAIAKALED